MVIASKWSIYQEHAVTAEDLGADGEVRDDVVERWVDLACAAYLDRCAVLHGLRERSRAEIRTRASQVPAGERLGRPTGVTVTATVPEIRPSSITIAVRLRPWTGDNARAFDIACFVSLTDPASGDVIELGDEIHDELIAIERDAPHFN